RNIARSISVASEIRELFEDLREKLRKEEKLVQEMIRTLVRGIEIRDSYTRGHSERVAYFSKKIAENMGLAPEKVNEVYMAALLHDIGKIGIPDSILLKPSRLTEKEYEIIKLHPILSYELLKNIEFLKGALDGIKYHHERWDGSGYPEGLKGKDIPLIARIIAVADSFDAMTSERIYRKGFSKVEAVKEIKALAGKHYDPEVVNNAVHILLSETPPTAEDYLSAKTIKEIEERRLDYFLRDSLTGVFSRNALEFAYALFKEKHGSFKAFALDVVKLREINIREGWKKGDEILKEVVKELEKIEGAAIVRYSGDNFIIFTPEELSDEIVREKIGECENRLNVQLRLTRLKNVGDVELLKQELTKLEFEENW
ncbi:MAG: HD domain-containing phosphohydrolase, partial [Desulfurobacteriaceae bacterium]